MIKVVTIDKLPPGTRVLTGEEEVRAMVEHLGVGEAEARFQIALREGKIPGDVVTPDELAAYAPEDA